LVVVVLLTLLAAVSPSSRRFVGSLIVVLLVFSAASAAVLASRGFGNETFQTKTDNDITVLSWNTLGDAPGSRAIADLALEANADVITLPETTESMGADVAVLMREAGHPMWVYTTFFDEVSKARSTTLLISSDLGEYTVQSDQGNTSTLPTVTATPDDGDGPTIVSVHPVAPVSDEMENWRSDLQWLAGICAGENTIMAGDFNSTLDHWGRLRGADDADFGQCTDAGNASGNGAIGTWPSDVPAILGTPIDHVLYTRNWEVSGMRVVQDRDDMGSDHRPVIVQLSPASN
jgi:endonuclease/exonuclease/phosphatase (EEP) superfamily protein YafD